jgi:hypothetical protein
MRVVRQEPSAAGKRLRPSREIARQEQASSYPQVLDEIFIDVLAGILPSLEPICHATAPRPRLIGRRIAYFGATS